jgi:hypothetical protein
MNNNDLPKDNVIIPFKPKIKEYPRIKEPKTLTLQEMGDDIYYNLHIINKNIGNINKITNEKFKAVEMKMRIGWFLVCITWGMLIGAFIVLLVRSMK